MTQYPDQVPFEAINVIVADIRNGAVAADHAQFAKAVWVVAGYALKCSLGDPTPTGFQSLPPLTDLQVAEYLESLATPGFQALPIPWLSILKWALAAIAAAI